MNKEYITNNSEETIELGYKIGKLLKKGMVITLNGDLGAGKTTLTKGVGKALGVKKVINSPTFTILKQYNGNIQLNHFDAYRLEGQSNDLGFDEIINGDGISIIEWSQYIDEILPNEYLSIYISRIGDTSRKFNFNSNGLIYDQILEVL